MVDLNQYEIFTRHMTSLKETSLDQRDDGQGVYMTESSKAAINFDSVKEEYVKDLGLCEAPKSNDALLKDSKGNLVFVEFKNGFMDRQKQFALRKKIYDSVLIFSDITSMGISELRKNMKYILVYNEGVNQTNRTDRPLMEKQKSFVQPSPSFDYFAKTIGRHAKKEYVCFGLNLFQNYCFKEVHTYTQQEFESYLEKEKQVS